MSNRTESLAAWLEKEASISSHPARTANFLEIAGLLRQWFLGESAIFEQVWADHGHVRLIYEVRPTVETYRFLADYATFKINRAAAATAPAQGGAT